MDSKVVQSNVHEYNEHHHPHTVGSQQVTHGADNQHPHDHEKKSVFKKVKEKARKIKDTIKKHGLHERDDERGRDQDLDEENDEQEVMAKDPEVHGAPIYDIANVGSTIKGSTIAGEPGVNLGSTRAMEEEHQPEPRIVVVSATTESDQNRATEAEKIFVDQEEKTGKRVVNLEGAIGLEKDPHAPGSRPEAYTASNYETKVTDPTGASAEEVHLTPVQESLARMNVQDEAKASPESNVLPTGDPSTGSHDQFSTEMSTEAKTQYSSATSHDQFALSPTPIIPNEVPENIETEPKVLTSGANAQYPSVGSHGQFIPDMSPSSRKAEYPSVGSHDQFVPEPNPTNPNKFPENLQAEPEVLTVAADIQYPSDKSHDQVLPDLSASATFPNEISENIEAEPKVLTSGYPSVKSRDQVLPDMSMCASATISSELSENIEAEPKVLTSGYPSVKSHDQVLPDMSASATIPSEVSENIEAEPKVLTCDADAQYPSIGSHDQFIPDLSTSSHEAQYPSVRSHDQFVPEPIPKYPNKFPENLQAEQEVLPVAADTQYLSVERQDQVLPDVPASAKTQYPLAAISSETSTVLPEVSTANETQNSFIGSHDQFAPEFIPTKLQENPRISGEILNTTTRDVEQPHGESTEKPSNQSGYTEKISSAPSAIADMAVSAKNAVASKRGYDGKNDRDENETRQEEYRSEEKPSNQSSYTEKFSSATSTIADKAVSAKNVVASKLGYDQKGDREENETRQEEYRSKEKPANQSSYTEKISSATSAIADKAVSAKNVVASELAYDEKGDRDENETGREEFRSEEKPANQSSYTGKISSAASAIADKAVSAKNVVTSKLGYDQKGDGDNNETRQEEYRGEEKPSNQGSYTEKISFAAPTNADEDVSAKIIGASNLGYDKEKEVNERRHEELRNEEKPLNKSSYPEMISSATSATADKAVSAKNVIASKFGYGEKGDKNDKTTSEVHERGGDAPTETESSAKYGQKIALSLTEELAPVYGKIGGAESAAISKTPETRSRASEVTTNETASGVPVQDKGVSVKDYLAEKLRPGDEDMALKELISDTLHKQKEKLAKGTVVDEGKTVGEVVSDAIHKQEVPKKAEHQHLDKVTESEEAERRLDSGNEKSDKGLEDSYVNSPRKGVIDKVKDVVGSWFGKPGDSQSLQGEGLPMNADGEAAHVGQRIGERGLHEGTN